MLEVQVTGHEHQWHVRYPGGDGRLGTADDVTTTQDVHLPTCTHARLRLMSEDYLYTLSLPHLGLSEIAVPDLTFTLEFETGPPGGFDLVGDQLCGYSYPTLMGKLVIESQEDFADWLESMQSGR